MDCDLDRVFGGFTSRVPEGPPGHAEFVFRPGELPRPPSKLRTSAIVVLRTSHGYNSWYRADALWFYLGRQKARELGVFFLACLFSGSEEETVLVLDHPRSDIRRIVVPPRPAPGSRVGLSLLPSSFSYFPAEQSKHPWLGETNVLDLPLLALTNVDDCSVTDEDWRERDTVRQESSDIGTARLAELLLNAGCSWTSRSEYDLEGDPGFRGVAPMSAEVRIWLSGSDGWRPEFELSPDEDG